MLPKWEFPSVHPEPRVSVFRRSGDYTVCFEVKVCVPVEDGHTCVYESYFVYVADLCNGNCGKIMDREQRRVDYTVEEIIRLRAKAKAAKAAYESAKSALYPFGENDL